MKKILITGSNGLLGQSIQTVFKRESEFELYPTSVEEKSDISNSLNYSKLDTTKRDDVKKIVREISPEVIINCAAYTDVDGCETHKEQCWKLNVEAVNNLITAVRTANARIIHYSTDYVFDGKNGPYSEEDKTDPVSYYGRSKLASENALKTGGLDYTIIRTMVLYGTGINVKPNFALWLISKLSKNEQVNIVDDQTGNYTVAEDLAYGTLKIIEKNCTGLYNIAGSDIISRYDFAVKLCDVFRFDKELIKKIKTADLNQPAVRPLNSGLIILKAQTELGFTPMDTTEGLQYLSKMLGKI